MLSQVFTDKLHDLWGQHVIACLQDCCQGLLFNMLQNSLGTEESYLRQLEIEEMYGVKKDEDKKSKEK